MYVMHRLYTLIIHSVWTCLDCEHGHASNCAGEFVVVQLAFGMDIEGGLLVSREIIHRSVRIRPLKGRQHLLDAHAIDEMVYQHCRLGGGGEGVNRGARGRQEKVRGG